MNKTSMMKRVSAVALGVVLAAGAANATNLKITIVNQASEGGITLTPLYTSIHDGSFDAFNPNEAASPGLRKLAEEGDSSVVSGERAAIAPSSQGAVAFGFDGFADAPVIEPGETASVRINNADPANRFFTYLSMVLPSNDTFIGNEDAMAYEVFDMAGNFLGPQTIQVTGADIWDAGTEQNLTDGSPFVPSLGMTSRTEEGGFVTAGQSLANFDGLTVANGQVINASLFDFLSNPAGFNVAEIRIEAVPIPATLPLLAGGLALLGWGARRRRA